MTRPPDVSTLSPEPEPAAFSAARRMDPAKYDAIHRSLLAGLLSNIGQKTEPHEYTGARGKKFYLFPGSTLFSRKPPWVMAGELTETTKLYARTVAKIDPAWVERAAEHLVKRDYLEPHWHRDSAHVVAFERVTLFGLVIVHRRRVHYGPINPKASRDIFIRQALVEGEYGSDAPYLRHNKQLVRDIELLEAKLRRRDVLVDAPTRFAFYDARVPADVYNGPLFEGWRRQAEAKDRRLLFMSKSDLMIPLPEPPKDAFPDGVFVGETRFPLTYRFEPGDPADGVTAAIPLGLLNQIAAEPFEWLVPGWLEDKVGALIKGLPKELRVPFVPVPDTVKAVVPLLRFGEGSLFDQLSWHLGRRAGVQVPVGAWDRDAVPDWLRMHFRVIDEAGKTLEAGRDLDDIRRKLRVEVKQTFDALPPGEWRRDNLTRWDFGDLPEVVEVKRPGITLKGYPALVDRGPEGVSLRLLESADGARAATRGGVRRLFMLQLGQEMKYLARNLPGIDAMCLHYATLGPGDELKRDVVNVAVDRAMYGDRPPAEPVRTRLAFAALAEPGWRGLSAATTEVCGLVGPVLTNYQSLARQLSGTFPPLLAPSIADMREQLNHLVYRGFVAATPYPWLRHYPRFLKGIELRLRKLLNAGASRDAQALGDIRPLWENYVRRAESHRRGGIHDPALAQYRWLLEELRISLFAQELKASVPVSVKRLQTLWADVQV